MDAIILYQRRGWLYFWIVKRLNWCSGYLVFILVIVVTFKRDGVIVVVKRDW